MKSCSYKRGLRAFSILAAAALVLASCSSNTTDSSSQTEESTPSQTTDSASTGKTLQDAGESATSGFIYEEERIEYMNSNCDQIPELYTAASTRYDETMRKAIDKGFEIIETAIHGGLDSAYQKLYLAITSADTYEDIDHELALSVFFTDLVRGPLELEGSPVFYTTMIDELEKEYGPVVHDLAKSTRSGRELNENRESQAVESEVISLIAILSNFASIATNEASTAAEIEAASMRNQETILSYISLLVDDLVTQSYHVRHMLINEFTFPDLGDNPLNLAASLAAESCNK